MKKIVKHYEINDVVYFTYHTLECIYGSNFESYPNEIRIKIKELLKMLSVYLDSSYECNKSNADFQLCMKVTYENE